MKIPLLLRIKYAILFSDFGCKFIYPLFRRRYLTKMLGAELAEKIMAHR